MVRQNLNLKNETLLAGNQTSAPYRKADRKEMIYKMVRFLIYNGSPIYFFTLLICCIFIGEAIVMLTIGLLPALSPANALLLDSTLLVVIILPFFYYLVFRPGTIQIRARKRTEEELKNALSQLEATFESIHSGILVASQGKVIKSNARFAEMWGISSEILNSDDNHQLTNYLLKQIIDPEYFTAKIAELDQNPEADSLDNIDLKDGRIFKLISRPMYMGGVAKGRVWSFLDITERRHAELALQKSEALYRNLVERLPDGVYKSTHEGKFVDVNPAMVKMLGYGSREELMAIDIKTKLYFKPGDRESLVLQENLEEKGIYPLRKKDGSEIWVEDHGWYNLDKNGEVLFHEGIIRDITERKKAEELIRLKNKELSKIVAEKDKFFSIIAHDLRSPFNGFLGLTQIMAEELPSLTMNEIQKMVTSMRNSATRLFRLLENLLEWSRMQQGLILVECQAVVLSETVAECLAALSLSAKIKGIEIHNKIPDDITVFVDINILQTVIRNLVSNAIKFTPNFGTIELSAKATVHRMVEIVVKDSGIGMNHMMLENLFRIDVQTRRNGTEGEPSTGLGLLLCKEFIEKLGGFIRAESEEGKGSTFFITVPLNL